jgi:acyl-CoA synthetase (AMP-forming)/AMP-acid ligase II
VTNFGESPLLEELLADSGEAPAIKVLGSKHPGLNRQALLSCSRAASRYLAVQGYGPGDVLAVWLPNTLSWMQLLFAAADLGILLVPISTRYKAAEVKHLLEVSKAQAIIVPRRFLDQDYAELAEQLRGEVASLERVFVQEDLDACLPWDAVVDPANQPDLMAERGVPASSLLSCFSTSGTTGYPKLAAHGHSSIARHALKCALALDLHAGDVMLCPLPLYGVFGYMAALAAIAGGASCVLMPVYEVQDAAKAIGELRVTHMIGSDAMFDAMLNVAGTNFTSWRRGVQADFVGLPLQVTQRGDERGIKFSGVYGSSECYSLMSFQDWGASAEMRARSGGTPHDEQTSVRIVDPTSGLEVARGESGEIQIRGPNVLAGYLNNPEATAKALTPDGWYRSGDLGYQEEGRGFVYLARMGDSLRLRGYLVNPAEIETCLMQHPAVNGAQVVGVNQPGKGDVAVAYVVVDEAHKLSEAVHSEIQAGPVSQLETVLIQHSKERLASYKVPQRIILIDEFPSINGPNGIKIQKRQLREMAKEALHE